MSSDKPFPRGAHPRSPDPSPIRWRLIDSQHHSAVSEKNRGSQTTIETFVASDERSIRLWQHAVTTLLKHRSLERHPSEVATIDINDSRTMTWPADAQPDVMVWVWPTEIGDPHIVETVLGNVLESAWQIPNAIHVIAGRCEDHVTRPVDPFDANRTVDSDTKSIHASLAPTLLWNRPRDVWRTLSFWQRLYARRWTNGDAADGNQS